MVTTLRTKFGIPGIVSVIALVFAMLGGAYAADNSGDDSKATASAKAKKGPRGPRGPRGPVGPAGPAGPQGPAGPKGETGAAGANGKDGAAGPTGATGPIGPAGPTGPAGATGATGATGAAGPAGPKGDPWTAGGTLPSGETETGAWGGVTGVTEETEDNIVTELWTAIGFNIPLAAEIAAAKVKTVGIGGSDPACDDGAGEAGNAKKPEADPGFLCVFVGVSAGSGVPGVSTFKLDDLSPGASPTGAILQVSVSAPDAEAGPVWGSWAVTAP